jgi:putative oxidoreductase
MVQPKTGEAIMNQHTVPIAAHAAEPPPMQRLADKLTSLVPPSAARPVLPQPSPAVAAALARSAAQAKDAARRARAQSLPGRMMSSLVFLPYSLVALALRIIIARVFFFDGQTRIDGPRLSYLVPGFDLHGYYIRGIDLSVILPVQPKVATVAAVFDSLESAMLSTFIGYVVAYAAFILPIMLVLGAGTRFVALGLVGLTVLMQLFIAPQDFWIAHIYWAAILVVLMSLGAGKISIDQVVRLIRGR